MSDNSGTTDRPVYSAERFKAFTDAVVAIALTLLILPLTDSLSELSDADGTALEWLAAERQPLFSFLLSFVLIASFWLLHHRLFTAVHSVNARLQQLTFAWMLSIVWLAVATSVIGQLPEDAGQKIIYIGSLLVIVVLLLVTRLYLRRHPELHTMAPAEQRQGILGTVANVFVILLALTLTLSFPVLGYWPMFLMFAADPLQKLLDKLTRR